MTYATAPDRMTSIEQKVFADGNGDLLHIEQRRTSYILENPPQPPPTPRTQKASCTAVPESIIIPQIYSFQNRHKEWCRGSEHDECVDIRVFEDFGVGEDGNIVKDNSW